MVRTGPLRDGSPAPATKLMGRILRTLVPKLGTRYVKNKPKRHDSKYIHTGKTLKPLKESGNVRIRDTLKNNWKRKAKIVEQHKSPRFCIVKTEDRNHFRRNQSFIMDKGAIFKW